MKHSCRAKQQGFGLTECLISMLILGLGLLGLASLQVAALRYNQESQFRLMAINQINSMADRMRANSVGVNNGGYNNITSTITNPNCTTCTPAQSAQLDGFLWNQEIARLLPAGQGQVTSLGGSVFDITVRWDARKTGATGTSCSGNPAVDLTCLRVRVEI